MTLYEWMRDEVAPRSDGRPLQQEAADILGVTRASLNAWLNGRACPPATRWEKLSARTGWMVRPHGFSRRWVSVKGDEDPTQPDGGTA